MHLPQRRSHQRSDENNFVATGCARKPQKFADLTNMHPVMWKPFNRCALGRSAQRKQEHRSSTRYHFFRHRQRQRASAAKERKRAFLSTVSAAVMRPRLPRCA